MKVSALVLPLLFTSSYAFSLLSQRFPRTSFGKYFEELDEMFEKDWPSTWMEKQLEEFKEMGMFSPVEGDKAGSPLATFKRSSPGYEVTDNSELFSVSLDVAGFKPDEINIGLKAGGQLLSITGHHKEEGEGRTYESRFQQNFSLDPSIVTDELTANFKDNKLIVSAPRNMKQLPENRKIPVQMLEGGAKQDEVKHDKVETKIEVPKEEEAKE